MKTEKKKIKVTETFFVHGREIKTHPGPIGNWYGDSIIEPFYPEELIDFKNLEDGKYSIKITVKKIP